MKHRRPTRFGLVFLFTLTTFVILLITIGIFGGIIYVLAEEGGLDSSAARLFPIVVSAFASLALGTIFSNFVVRIPLRPFKRLEEACAGWQTVILMNGWSLAILLCFASSPIVSIPSLRSFRVPKCCVRIL